MNKIDLLQLILSERPNFHRSETEVARTFLACESLLLEEAAMKLAKGDQTCYGLDREVLLYIYEQLGEGSKTLETGAGCSTLIFALRKTEHISVTPSESEVELIRQYATRNAIPFQSIRFATAPSESYLPQCPAESLDLVLIDGKHAFPWPIIDWFYTADKLRIDGLMILDDAQMTSVSMLAGFLRTDPRWKLVRDFFGRTLVFQKNAQNVHDVSWHMQPFVVPKSTEEAQARTIFSRIKRKIKRVLSI